MRTDNIFPMRAPKSYLQRIQKNDANDPLLKQIVPTKEELQDCAGYSDDPLQEKKIGDIVGLLHKYYGRVLLLVTDNCAINCRFCFRRYLHNVVTDWQQVLNYIAKDITISEVILSGGDPLISSDAELALIINKLAKIKHIKRVRIHTRIPIVDPKRVTAKLCALITKTRIPIVVVVHCNHPNEINADVATAIKALKKFKITVLNQSVLLKGINDDQKVLVELSEKLFALGILPYYLHMLDKVKGAAHFCVDDKKAKKIMRELRAKLPGYLVPKLVRDDDERCKTQI